MYEHFTLVDPEELKATLLARLDNELNEFVLGNKAASFRTQDIENELKGLGVYVQINWDSLLGMRP